MDEWINCLYYNLNKGKTKSEACLTLWYRLTMISNKTCIRKFNYNNGIYLPVTPCSIKCVFLPIHYLLTLLLSRYLMPLGICLQNKGIHYKSTRYPFSLFLQLGFLDSYASMPLHLHSLMVLYTFLLV